MTLYRTFLARMAREKEVLKLVKAKASPCARTVAYSVY